MVQDLQEVVAGRSEMNVALHTVNVLELCSGIGGLGEGLRAAVPRSRVVCHVERESTAAAVLVARMADKSLDDAPIWTDLKTFDARPWRGVVDIVTGGYPCQPFSTAGKRQGTSDPRHIWPDVLRIVRESKPEWCFFENVAGHLSLGYHDVVKPDLEDAGYRVAEGIFTAQEVGAPHRRERLFILAHHQSVVGQREFGAGDSGRQPALSAGNTGRDVANPVSGQLRQAAPSRADREGGVAAASAGATVADACQPRREGRLLGRSNDSARRQEPHGRIATGDFPMAFPPGPSDTDAWTRVLAARPDLAPAVADTANRKVRQVGVAPRFSDAYRLAPQSEVRSVDDGLPRTLALSRTDKLRLLGNSVVPQTVALAFITLRRKLDD